MENLFKKIDIDIQFSKLLPVLDGDNQVLDFLINEYILENPNEIPFMSKLSEKIMLMKKVSALFVIDYKSDCIDSLLGATLLNHFLNKNKLNAQIKKDDSDLTMLDDYITVYIGYPSNKRYDNDHCIVFTNNFIKAKISKTDFLISGKLSKNMVLKDINLTTTIFYLIRYLSNQLKTNNEITDYLLYVMVSIILSKNKFNKDERAIIKKSFEILKYTNHYSFKTMLTENNEVSYDYVYSIKDYLKEYFLKNIDKTLILLGENNLAIPVLLDDFKPKKTALTEPPEGIHLDVYIWQINKESVRFLQSLYPYEKPFFFKIMSISNYIKIEKDYINVNNILYIKNNQNNVDLLKNKIYDITGKISVKNDKIYLDN